MVVSTLLKSWATTAGQHANRLYSLCAVDMVAGLAPFRLILAEPDKMGDQPLVVAQRQNCRLRPVGISGFLAIAKCAAPLFAANQLLAQGNILITGDVTRLQQLWRLADYLTG